MRVYTYKVAQPREFDSEWDKGSNEEEIMARVRDVQMRRECRGIVLDEQGVVARPVHKFFSVGQVQDYDPVRMAEVRVTEATEKLDGAMVFGVVKCDVVELWTRGGRTKVAAVINTRGHINL